MLKILCSTAVALAFVLWPNISKADRVYLQNTVYPFTSDGCSIVPDGTINEPTKWQACCVAHDIAYWMGGTKAERADADRKLGQCIGERQNKVIGEMYHIGVVIGGSPQFATKFRWGYGWKYNRGYRELNEAEVAQIDQVFPKVVAIPVEIHPGNRPVAYPTETGNYCLDEVLALLKKHDPSATVQMESRVDSRGFVRLKTNLCEGGIIARFSVHDSKLCTEPRYRDFASSYLSSIHPQGDCAQAWSQQP